MTPERAAAIAGGLRFQYAMSNAANDAIKDAILRACAEQREADATTIFMTRILAKEDDADDLGVDGWLEYAEKAIRSAE